jgi:hypothetical protein
MSGVEVVTRNDDAVKCSGDQRGECRLSCAASPIQCSDGSAPSERESYSYFSFFLTLSSLMPK